MAAIVGEDVAGWAAAGWDAAPNDDASARVSGTLVALDVAFVPAEAVVCETAAAVALLSGALAGFVSLALDAAVWWEPEWRFADGVGRTGVSTVHTPGGGAVGDGFGAATAPVGEVVPAVEATGAVPGCPSIASAAAGHPAASAPTTTNSTKSSRIMRFIATTPLKPLHKPSQLWESFVDRSIVTSLPITC
jgi:hypothetical protein